MLWIAQSTENYRIVGIYRDETSAWAAWGDNDNVYIYWTESDL